MLLNKENEMSKIKTEKTSEKKSDTVSRSAEYEAAMKGDEVLCAKLLTTGAKIHRIVAGAAAGGHEKFMNVLIEKAMPVQRQYLINEAAVGAAVGKQRELRDKLILRGAVTDNIAEELAAERMIEEAENLRLKFPATLKSLMAGAELGEDEEYRSFLKKRYDFYQLAVHKKSLTDDYYTLLLEEMDGGFIDIGDVRDVAIILKAAVKGAAWNMLSNFIGLLPQATVDEFSRTNKALLLENKDFAEALRNGRSPGYNVFSAQDRAMRGSGLYDHNILGVVASYLPSMFQSQYAMFADAPMQYQQDLSGDDLPNKGFASVSFDKIFAGIVEKIPFTTESKDGGWVQRQLQVATQTHSGAREI